MIQPGLISTLNGSLFNIVEPNQDDIDLEHIAHCLSNLCRWGGSSKEFYSVAQHSVYVAMCAPFTKKLAALLHDATEAYMTDLPRPLKALLPEYRKMESRLGAVIAMSFGLHAGAFEDPDVKRVDDFLMGLEALEMKANGVQVCMSLGGVPDYRIQNLDDEFHYWSPAKAKQKFLDAYHFIRMEYA